MHLRFLTRARLAFCGVLSSAALLAGCSNDEIAVYSVPKEIARPAASSSESGAVPRLHYDTPEGWQEQRPSKMRMVGFKINGSEGQVADVAVTPMPLLTIPKTNLVNMWREQVKLPPLNESELDRAIEKVRIGDTEGEMFDLVSSDTLVEGKYPLRILVAMLNRDGLSWFFKVSGAADLVAAERAHFLHFLGSITFDYTEHDSTPGPATSTNIKSTGTPDPVRPQWTVPPTWKEQPPAAFSLARFAIGTTESGKGDITVSLFPGNAGGTLENVNRWRGQLGLPTMTADELKDIAKPADPGQPNSILVDFVGKDVRGGTDRPTRMVAAIITQASQTWIYKMMGDEPVVGGEKAAFVEFIQSARYTHEP